MIEAGCYDWDWKEMFSSEGHNCCGFPTVFQRIPISTVYQWILDVFVFLVFLLVYC